MEWFQMGFKKKKQKKKQKKNPQVIWLNYLYLPISTSDWSIPFIRFPKESATSLKKKENCNRIF